MKKLYTVQELAEMMNVATNTIYKYEKTGQIKCIKNLRPMRFTQDEVERLIGEELNKETEEEKKLKKENKKLKNEIQRLKGRLNRIASVACSELAEEVETW